MKRILYLLYVFFVFHAVPYATETLRQPIEAVPETEKVEGLIGHLKLEDNVLSFSKVGGHLRLEQEQDIPASATDRNPRITHVFKIGNFAEFLQNERADYFCPKVSEYVLIRRLSDDAIRVTFLQKGIAEFVAKLDGSVCSSATYTNAVR